MLRPFLLAAAFCAACPAAMAVNNNIVFEGEVTAQTCHATVAGHEQAVVLMPPVTVDELRANHFAGATPFHVEVSGCKASGQPEDIYITFSAPYLVGKHLANRAPKNPAKDVSVRLSEGLDNETIPLDLGPTITDHSAIKLKAGETSARSIEYTAWYHAESDDITSGKVRAVIYYTLGYP